MAGDEDQAGLGYFSLPESLGELKENLLNNVSTISRNVASALSAKAPEATTQYLKMLQTRAYPGSAAESLAGIKGYVSNDPNDPLSYQNQLEELQKHINIFAWRPDIKSPGKLETLPIGWDQDAKKIDRFQSLNTNDLRTYAEALRDAQAMGFSYPKEITTPQFLAALALREGRGDYGSNTFNRDKLTNKTALQIYSKLLDQGKKDTEAGFAAMMYEKAQDSKRLNKPFTELWNGGGKFKDPKTGKIGGGKFYARNFGLFEDAAVHPKNASLLHFIAGSLMPDSGHKRGGSIENTTHTRKII